MKRFGLVFLLLLLASTGAAFAAEGLTVINQSGMAVTATLSQSSSMSQPLTANETYVFGPFPPVSQFVLKISSKTVNISSPTFGPEIKYATFRRAGQVFRIFLSATPPPAPAPKK
jgi:hypothetical protein